MLAVQAKGKLVELSNHHTASRIIQFCVKYGTVPERKAIMEEVKAKIVELAKSKYGHHLVQKLITVSSKQEVPGARARASPQRASYLHVGVGRRRACRRFHMAACMHGRPVHARMHAHTRAAGCETLLAASPTACGVMNLHR